MEITQVLASRRADYWSTGNFRLSRIVSESRAMKDEVIAGLRSIPKAVSPKYLYDAEGSRLFDCICRLPEYYPTRTETSILERHGGAILDRLGGDLVVIEIGAGACHKGRLLLETGRVSTFIPVDISTDYLRGAALRVAHIFPHVSVHAVAMDFLVSFESLQSLIPHEARRVIFYAGSSIGNFDPWDASRLLRRFSGLLREDDALLIGYDLKKDPNILRRAYDDSRGVTAAFNLNLLARFNRDLGADFNLTAFRHLALYDETMGRIEMHLESLSAQEITIGNERIAFERFECIHTENSYKYTVDEFDAMAANVGLVPVAIWMDRESYFAVGLYARHEFRRPGERA
jgi:dimethylhistidine N-methyltransferase